MHVTEREYATVATTLRTWDLLLFSSPDPLSRGIRCLQRRRLGSGTTDHSHAGVVVRANDLPRGHAHHGPPDLVYVFESVLGGPSAGGVGRVPGNDAFFGVQLRPLHEVLRAAWLAQGRVVWCPLDRYPALDRCRQGAFPQLLVDKYNGTPYDWRPTTLCGSILPCCRPLRALSQHLFGCCFRRRRLICSQLVAHIYQDLGLIDREVDPRDVVPADFVARATMDTTADEDEAIPLLVSHAYRLMPQRASTHVLGSAASSARTGTPSASMRGMLGDSSDCGSHPGSDPGSPPPEHSGWV